MSNHASRNGQTTTLLGPSGSFFGLLIVIVLIIGIVIVPALLITNGTGAEKRPTTVVWVAVTIGVTSSIVIVLLSIVFCCLLLRGINRALPLFGATAVDRLLGLGVTILLLPTTAKLVFTCGVKFVSTVLRLIPSLLVNVLNIYASSASKPVGAQTGIIQRVLGPLRDSLNAISRNSLEKFPFAEFLIGLAVWALCGQLLRTVPAQPDGQSRTRLQQLANRMSRVAWLNTLLFALIGIAFYFSIAAIVTVPSIIALTSHLEPTSQTFQTLHSLKEKNSETAKAKFEKDFPSNYGEEIKALTSLENALKDAENKKIDPYAQETIEKMKRYSKDIRDSLQKELRSTWNMKLKLAWDFNEKLITRAVEAFENANSVGNGTRELVQYSREITDWYDTNWDSIQVDLRSDRGKIELRNSQITKSAEACLALLTQLSSKTDAETANSFIKSFQLTNEDFPNISKIDLLKYQAEPDDSIDITTVTLIEDCPEVPELYLGPFRAIAGWLLETRSLPLAMIIGMLGFGLLGSAVSTFVREQSERSANEGKTEEQKRITQDPLVADLAGVLIRGLSAAIIVFLAALGGLAVIGTGKSEPNPYVLFLGCLVGAVFSQEVWDWARRWMQSTTFTPGGGDIPKTSHEPQSKSQPETSETASSTDELLSKASSVSDTSSHFDSLSEVKHSSESTSEPGDSPPHQPPDTPEPKPVT